MVSMAATTAALHYYLKVLLLPVVKHREDLHHQCEVVPMRGALVSLSREGAVRSHPVGFA